jgi:hypothetical protein
MLDQDKKMLLTQITTIVAVVVVKTKVLINKKMVVIQKQ